LGGENPHTCDPDDTGRFHHVCACACAGYAVALVGSIFLNVVRIRRMTAATRTADEERYERLTELCQKLGIAVAEMEVAYRFAQLQDNYEKEVMGPLRECKVKIDWFIDSLPKKQQAVYAQSLEERNKAHKAW
jgi:hypothetical protein